MKKFYFIFTLATLLLCNAEVTAQATYKVVGNQIVRTDSLKTKKQSRKTNLIYTIKGVEYPVYQGTKGGYYIIRTSKKSGKEYRQYFKITE